MDGRDGLKEEVLGRGTTVAGFGGITVQSTTTVKAAATTQISKYLLDYSRYMYSVVPYRGYTTTELNNEQVRTSAESKRRAVGVQHQYLTFEVNASLPLPIVLVTWVD